VSLAIIEENVRPAPDRVNYQIQVSVSIDIHQRNSRGIQVGAGHPGFFGNVLKSPVSQVSKEAIAGLEATKVQIA
jgi:hypothetical protein